MFVSALLTKLFRKPYRSVDPRQAAALIAGEGRQVHDLAGGLRAWNSAGMPLQAKGGRPLATLGVRSR
ncbi:hypothetical protein [Micromonospora sp. ATCC 39149]|uniref:Rhodanese domain-containing protein n=1 Tax=Micromonospora carbonacea TaxID=47853 RepID=A0A7D5YI85_9ACTN|nr:hypothetical protein [Micromonospora sp. ATCC 39149]QLJ98494.1 hypothetical protein HZU44_28155 [Micromonospora carbonacea]